MSEITKLKGGEQQEGESTEEFFMSLKRQFRDHAMMAASIPVCCCCCCCCCMFLLLYVVFVSVVCFGCSCF